MPECTIIVQPTQTLSEAERRRRWSAIYRIILEALREAAKEQQQNAQQQIAQDVKR